MVGEYSAIAKAGDGFVWYEVLKYRVWCYPEEGDDYYYAFEDVETALEYSSREKNAQSPLALILQNEYISENEPGVYLHVKEKRATE